MSIDPRSYAEQVCNKAARAIAPSEERERTHGSIEYSFNVAANLMTSMLGVPITPAQVAGIMICLKLSRIATGDPSHEDHYVDIAGYAGLMAALNRESTIVKEPT